MGKQLRAYLLPLYERCMATANSHVKGLRNNSTNTLSFRLLDFLRNTHSTMAVFAFFLFLLSYTPPLHFRRSIGSATASATIYNRRTLHQPFFPLTLSSFAPTQPPSSSFPKHPTSSSSSSSHHSLRPFFPLYPFPPPPPRPFPATTTTALPTFPANISSLVSNPSGHASPRFVPAVASPLLPLALLGLSFVLFLCLCRRCRRAGADKDARSGSLGFFPSHAAAPDGEKLSATSSFAAAAATPGPSISEFLYLGTLVTSRVRETESSASPYRKLGSPKLHPLPPLPRQFRSADASRSSSSGFYSPKNSQGAKGSAAGMASRSKEATLGVLERCGSRSSTLSTPSYLSSNVASSPSPSSPTTSSLPPSLLRLSTSSPPKARPRPHSPPSSPPGADCDRRVGTLRSSGQNLRSPNKIGDFAKGSIAVELNPPLPPPPTGFQEDQNVKMPAFQPPVLLPPRDSVVWNSSITSKYANAAEKHENNPRPKSEPLHWDKVRASSDRKMVWDQHNSGSFQLKEEMIETLFGGNTSMAPKGMTGGLSHPSSNQESCILDPKKSQNIATMLKALHVSEEEVCEALLEGITFLYPHRGLLFAYLGIQNNNWVLVPLINLYVTFVNSSSGLWYYWFTNTLWYVLEKQGNADGLGNEVLEVLMKMVPSKEEERKLKEHKDDSPDILGPAESFLKAVLRIPFAFKRVDAMLYVANFDSEVNRLRNLFGTLQVSLFGLLILKFHQL
ncbi:hypothetical protein BHE74_00020840 [Ensete ventricosum]|nr:hypothetical protein BHE74_00020840 [Ensete ventricosum]